MPSCLPFLNRIFRVGFEGVRLLWQTVVVAAFSAPLPLVSVFQFALGFLRR